MMWDGYANKGEIDKLQKAIHDISPDLTLSRFTLSNTVENTAVAAGLYIQEKGNKNTIEKLLGLGFRKVHRRKQAQRYWDISENYSFVVCLEKTL